jgi:hypothetical protein
MRQQTFVSEASKSKGKKGATPMAPPMLARNHPGNTIAVQTTQLRPLRPGVPVLEPSAGAIFALQRILANRLWSVSLLPLVVAAILAAAPAAALDVRQNVGFSAVNLNPWTGGADFEKTFPVLDDLQVDFQADIPNLGVTPTGFLADLLGIDADILSASIGGSASGRVGVDFGYHVNGGRLNVNYPAVAQLEVGTIPGTNAVRAGSQFSIASSFKPGLERAYLPVRSTLLSVGGPGYGETSIPGFSFDVFETPSFSTTFPNASVWADAYFDVDASVYAEARGLAIAGFCAACIRKDFKVDLPEQRFRIVEVDRDSVYVPGLVNLPLDQPIPISNFASVQLSYPDVRVESGALEADGTLRGAGAKPVIQVFGSIDDFIPLVGAFLDGSIPPIDYTLASTDGGPTLGLYQDLQLDVSPKVQLEFSEAVLARDATGEFSLTRTVEFALGQQVDVRTVFGSSGAITVKPTYDLGATFRNETGLSLGVGLEVKGPEFTLGDLGSLGPLGSERLDLEIARYPLFQDSFTIDAGGQITGDPFTIRKDLGAVLFPDVTASASALALDVGDCTGTGIGGQVRCWASYVNPFNGDAGELEVTGTLLRLPLEDPFGGQLDTFQEILVADSEILLELNGFDPEEPSAYAAFSLGDALCVFCADLSGLFEMTSPFVEEAGEKLFLSSLFEYSDGEICLECDPVLSQSNLFSQLGAPTTITETSATEPVPEPGTLALLGIGLAVQTSLGRRRRRALSAVRRAEPTVAAGGSQVRRIVVTPGIGVGSACAPGLSASVASVGCLHGFAPCTSRRALRAVRTRAAESDAENGEDGCPRSHLGSFPASWRWWSSCWCLWAGRSPARRRRCSCPSATSAAASAAPSTATPTACPPTARPSWARGRMPRATPRPSARRAARWRASATSRAASSRASPTRPRPMAPPSWAAGRARGHRRTRPSAGRPSAASSRSPARRAVASSARPGACPATARWWWVPASDPRATRRTSGPPPAAPWAWATSRAAPSEASPTTSRATAPPWWAGARAPRAWRPCAGRPPPAWRPSATSLTAASRARPAAFPPTARWSWARASGRPAPRPSAGPRPA